ncbi:spore germination protein PC [Scopulibacillus daqui]|uniref:Spore germination protein PC n=1 Tax=Scopulibacillus daqui TaxID=1469162 RepID=A0ABS2PYY4_9BACL|nr:spore germination protein PC [Scopulibacillus daqui]
MNVQQPYQWQRIIQHLHGTVNTQEKRIRELERMIKTLRTDLDGLQKQQPLTVNYSFDQLKIDTLEGTLNIGLNPNKDMEDLDDFTINDQTIHAPEQPVDPASAVMNEVNSFLNQYFSKQAYEDLRTIEQEKGYPLDDTYRQFIINDVQKQLHNRAQYYLSKYQEHYLDNQEELVDVINEKLHDDIRRAFSMFIDYLPKKRRDSQ